MKFTNNENRQYGFLVNVEQRTNQKTNEIYYRYEVITGSGQVVSCLANTEQHATSITEGLIEGKLVNVSFSKNDNGYWTITQMDVVTQIPKKQQLTVPASILQEQLGSQQGR
jgi:hypothetical protein